MWGLAASLAGSLFKGSGSSSSSTSSATQSNSATNSNSSTSKGTEQSSSASSQILSNLLDSLTNVDNTYSKQSAINDAQDAATAASNSILQQAVPAAILGQNAAGGYSSSGTKRATEDAAARAQAAYAQTILSNINQYAAQANQQKQTTLSGLSSILGLIQDANSSTKSSSTTDSTSNTNSTTSSSSSKSGFGGMSMTGDQLSSAVETGGNLIKGIGSSISSLFGG